MFNTFNCNYPVIEESAEKLGYKVTDHDHNLRPCQELLNAHKLAPGLYTPIKPEEFDIVWFDLSISPETVSKLHAYQRVS